MQKTTTKPFYNCKSRRVAKRLRSHRTDNMVWRESATFLRYSLRSNKAQATGVWHFFRKLWLDYFTVVYLIFDTNIWLYLANGLDPQTGKHHDKLHFELLKSLQDLKAKKNVTILINEIVINEWNKNKHHAREKVEFLNRKLANPDSAFAELKKHINVQDSLKDAYIEGLKKDIKANEDHIKNVEEFLLNSCFKVEISQSLKLKIFDLSTTNKAPFHNKKNNVADAAILLSSDEYLSDHLHFDEEAIFISNNFTDFSEAKGSNKFHVEILDILQTKIKYQQILPAALKLSQNIITEMEEFYKHQAWLESVAFNCRTPNCESIEELSPWGHLDKTLPVEYENDPYFNPSQGNLFPDIPIQQKIHPRVRTGDCLICGTKHLECPVCDTLTYTGDETEEFRCEECDSKLVVRYNARMDEMCLYINEVDSEED